MVVGGLLVQELASKKNLRAAKVRFLCQNMVLHFSHYFLWVKDRENPSIRGQMTFLQVPKTCIFRLLHSAFPLPLSVISVGGPNYRERFNLQGFTVLIGFLGPRSLVFHENPKNTTL